jgi:serine/threonine protein kinase
MDQGTFYILFPLAECNLRTFLNRVTAPPVHRDVVLWFFSQLKGLADAVLHLHSLRDSMSKGQTDSSDEFIQSLPILHGDIKPENILVFPSTSEASLGIMKLTDFGSALTNEEEQRSLPLAKIQTRGTKAYECPDMLISSEASYKTDIWSLSCVFLELLDWLFYPPGSEEIGFMTQRSIDTLSCSSSFWRFKENGEVELKKSVDRRLYELERPCTGRLGLEYLLALLWDTFLLQQNKDLSAQRVLNEIGRCISQAELDLADDPNFYIDPTPRMREEEAKRVRSWTSTPRWTSAKG